MPFFLRVNRINLMAVRTAFRLNPVRADLGGERRPVHVDGLGGTGFNLNAVGLPAVADHGGGRRPGVSAALGSADNVPIDRFDRGLIGMIRAPPASLDSSFTTALPLPLLGESRPC